MKAKLLENLMGKTSGTVFEVTRKGTHMSTIRDSGGETDVPTDALEFLPEDEEKPEVENFGEDPFASEPEPLVERLAVDEDTEAEARAMYDDYTAAVGGKAFNGNALPPASEFFEDPAKQKQANAWRTVAANADDRFYQSLQLPEGLEDIETDENPQIARTMRAKLQVASVEPSGDGEQIRFHGVSKSTPYPEDGYDEDNSFAKFSPSVSLDISIQNPALKGKLKQGQKYYADFTLAEDVAEDPAQGKLNIVLDEVDEAKALADARTGEDEANRQEPKSTIDEDNDIVDPEEKVDDAPEKE
jgi:hypothetical protein